MVLTVLLEQEAQVIAEGIHTKDAISPHIAHVLVLLERHVRDVFQRGFSFSEWIDDAGSWRARTRGIDLTVYGCAVDVFVDIRMLTL